MRRFLLLALATLAGYAAVMSVLIAGTIGWSIHEAYEWDLLPVPRGEFVGAFAFSLTALLTVWGHIAILRRVRGN